MRPALHSLSALDVILDNLASMLSSLRPLALDPIFGAATNKSIASSMMPITTFSEFAS
jgi:hypothetical protein